jgi:hypothetical protein
MSRPWARWFGATVNHPKFIALSPIERGAWFTLWLVGMQTEGRFPTRQHAEATLVLYRVDDATEVVNELLRLGCLDQDSDGHVDVHGWNDHQPAWRGPSDNPEAKSVRNAAGYASRKTQASANDIQRESATPSDRESEGRGRVRGRTKESPFANARNVGTNRGERPDRADLAAFWDRRWKLAPKQIKVLDHMVREDGGPARLARIIDGAPAAATDLFGWVIGQFNAERDQQRAEAKAAEELQNETNRANGRAGHRVHGHSDQHAADAGEVPSTEVDPLRETPGGRPRFVRAGDVAHAMYPWAGSQGGTDADADGGVSRGRTGGTPSAAAHLAEGR